MDCLDEVVDPGRHDEEIPGGEGTRIPICVGGSARDDSGAARTEFELLVATADTEHTFKDVPSFVVGVVEVPGRDVSW